MNIVEVWQVDDSGNKMVPTRYNFKDSSQGVDTAIKYYVQTLRIEDCIKPIKVFARSVSYYPEEVYCVKVSAKLSINYCKSSETA